MEPIPDLTTYFAIHDQMRVDTRRYVAAVEAALPTERGRRLDALARWAKGFAHELHLHHTVEDEVIFPDLASRVATARPLLDELARDHDVVAGILAAWPAAAARLADHRQPFDASKEAVLSLAVPLRDVLHRHLDIEDADVLPLFYRHYTGAEYDALHERATASIPMRGLMFSVPWNVELHEGERRARLIAEGPAGLRLVYRFSKRRFRHTVAAAFAGVDLPAGV